MGSGRGRSDEQALQYAMQHGVYGHSIYGLEFRATGVGYRGVDSRARTQAGPRVVLSARGRQLI